MSTPDAGDFWTPLRAHTRARIGLGRAGDALPTTALLEQRTAHAEARDAVHQPWDVEAIASGLRDLGLDVHRVHSRAADRGTYLTRPDLGRLPDDLDALPFADADTYDVGLVLADGLSARAHDEHAVATVSALVDRLRDDELTLAPVVLAEQARVGIGDAIGEHLGATTLIVLVGERPGLSVANSLGAYLTHRPRAGRRDSERNCVSNIHPPDGQDYDRAAATLHALVSGARALGGSGVRLKDTAERGALEG